MSLAAVPPSSGQFLHLREIHVTFYFKKNGAGGGGALLSLQASPTLVPLE
jgi:hypothetical protein